MTDVDVLVPVLIGLSVVLLLIALGHGFAVRRHWRARRHAASLHRGAWLLVFLLLSAFSAAFGLALRGYRLLTTETQIATLTARKLGPQEFAVRIDFPDGRHRGAELHGDEWQLDARVIKWTPRAVEMGAQPLYRVERISGRYHDASQASAAAPSVVPLDSESVLDLWRLKQRFPRWLPMIDADYGSGAYLPLVDNGRYRATLSPLGGLIARPADAETAAKLKALGW